MADSYHLSFLIGPVQSFVEQARRTRDLWAGSWLLSYLAESALAAAEQADGKAIIPARSKKQQGVVTAKHSAVGGIPNRFELRFEGEDAKQRAIDAAHAAINAFNNAWKQIAQSVFDQFITDDVQQKGHETADIWNRQVDNFWELSWVVGQPDDSEQTIGRLAAMRKNYRNVPATDEPGVKCSLMPRFQELSGHLRREKQQVFWSAVASKVSSLDMGESERLCAIALIKRLFPKVIKRAIGEDISDELNQVAWPSTAFLAAIPWLKEFQGDALELAKDYQQKAFDLGYRRSETQAAKDANVAWASFDGPVWFSSAIRNDEPGQRKLRSDQTEEQRKEHKEKIARLLKELDKVYRAAAPCGKSVPQHFQAASVSANAEDQPAGKPAVPIPGKPPVRRPPVPYYALLLMDGDSMGQLLGELGSPEKLSECLGRFSSHVEEIVKQHDGRTVYAGGDDVLALLPAVSALQCAEELRTAYGNAFKDKAISADVATISAAVVYAHWRYPLRQVLATAHHLLDEVAKDRTGRDSVAIGIILGSGLNAVWSVPWRVYHGNAQTADCPCASLESMLDCFESAELENSPNPPFNASYLYLLRERFWLLLGEGRDRPGEFVRFSNRNGRDFEAADLLRDLAHAEYRRRMKKSVRAETPIDHTQPIVDGLMSLSRAWQRQQTGVDADCKTQITCDPNAFSFDGWRIARFLKQIKDGKVPDHD